LKSLEEPRANTWFILVSANPSKLPPTVLSIGNVLLAATEPPPGGATSGKVFRSPNAGETWVDVTSGGLDGRAYRTLAVDPRDTNIIYVADGNSAGAVNIYKSGDQGFTWNKIYTGLVDELPQVMLVDDLLAGLNTGLFGLSQSRASLRIAYAQKIVTCTLKVGGTAARRQFVLIEKKAPKKRIWKRATRVRTNSKGKVTYNASSLALGTSLRCNWSGQKSTMVRR
jgi:hypothetical protein